MQDLFFVKLESKPMQIEIRERIERMSKNKKRPNVMGNRDLKKDPNESRSRRGDALPAKNA